MTEVLSEEHILKIKEVYDLFDKDGCIVVEELATMLRNVNLGLLPNHQTSDKELSTYHSPAFTTHGLQNEVIKLYISLWANGIKLGKFVIIAVAKASGASSDFSRVKEVHDNATCCGMTFDVFLGNTFVHAYAKCKCFDGARQGVVVFREMGLNGVKPNSVIVSSILLACLELKILDSGRAIHGFAVRHGMVENVFVCCALISIHSRPVDDGLLIFNSMGRAHSLEPDASHYSSMADVFSHAGHLDEA
ncbi:PREDICTED: pentatricopeptide repeat-containing protein At2g33680-like [Lupinus angustifolius]|uniref:pentatricopeptide repeat-containing protein At2g33680-like n=1 Tax=Lupinus angustifolius TaxID=3871 RepID=UPI00092F4244|nr:PREDICTED: pentatricopeptide repeat-containing protein At2g33680-like [Lupinus angustifolius]